MQKSTKKTSRNAAPIKTFIRVFIVAILGVTTSTYEKNITNFIESDQLIPSTIILLVIFVAYAIIEAKFPEDEVEITGETTRRKFRQSTTFFVERFSPKQLTFIAIGVVIFVAISTWVVSEWIQENLPLIWQLFPFYYTVGPFLYVISSRRGIAGVVQFILIIAVGQQTLPGINMDGIIIIALVSAVVQELTFSILHSKEGKVWLCVFATAFSVASTWGVLIYIKEYYKFDPLQIVGGGIAGFLVFFAGELILELINMKQENE